MISKPSYRLFPLVLIFAVILVILSASTPSHAQSDDPPGTLLLAYSISDIGNWSSDERYLEVSIDFGQFMYLAVATKQLIPIPKSAQLTAQELNLWKIEPTTFDYRREKYAISPDGRYVAYSSLVPQEQHEDGGCPSRQIKLANRESKLSIDLPLVRQTATGFRWNRDNRGFVIEQIEGCEGPAINGPIAYVSNSSPAFTDLHVVTLDELPYFDGNKVLSVSRDGQWILVAAVPCCGTDGHGPASQLMLVNVSNPRETKLIARDIDGFLTACFEDEMPTTIFMLSISGLTELGLTGQQRVLNTILKTTGDDTDYSSENYVRLAAFSPSGRWLAYTHVGNGGGESLYLLDLHALRHPNSPTPTISPTFTPVKAINP